MEKGIFSLKEHEAFTLAAFLTSLSEEPLLIKFKTVAHAIGVSEATLSKMRNLKLRRVPESFLPSKAGERFAEGILNAFPRNGKTTRMFQSYASLLMERFQLSPELALVCEKLHRQAPSLYQRDLVYAFLFSSYQEAYGNSQMIYSNRELNSHVPTQAQVVFGKACSAINRDLFNRDQVKQLLNLSYSACLREGITAYSPSTGMAQLLENYVKRQMVAPYFKSMHRSEVISIDEGESTILRRVKGKDVVVYTQPGLQTYELKYELPYSLKEKPHRKGKTGFGMGSCTINGIPVLEYEKSHGNKVFKTIEDMATVREIKDELSGSISTEVTLRFGVYPKDEGEMITIVYHYWTEDPFIQNVSGVYTYSLPHACMFFEHEFLLDEKTSRHWGIRAKVFAPFVMGIYEEDDYRPTDKYYVENSGTKNVRRVTFYDWVPEGSGYCRSLYRLPGKGLEDYG